MLLDKNWSLPGCYYLGNNNFVYVLIVFSLETEALQKLLRAHLDIQKWQFYPSVIALQEAKVKLDEWNLMIQGREVNIIKIK